MPLSIEDRIIKAKISLGIDAPFYADLLMYMTLIKTSLIPTMAIDIRGRMSYNEKFVETLTDSQLKCVTCHEIGHIVYGHLKRLKKEMDPMRFNIAADIVINNMLVEEGYGDLPPGGLIPKGNRIEIPGPKGKMIVIDEISKKSTEQIYHLIPAGTGNPGFDKHERSEDDDEDELNEDEESALEEEWKQRIAGALTKEKAAGGGSVTGSRHEHIDKLLNPKIPWRTILHKYIQQNIIVDYTWRKPSKRSQALGMYLPSNYKENISLLAVADTSGSVGTEELQMYITELYSILSSYPNIDITFLSGDTQLRTTHKLSNTHHIDPKELLVAGGGGNDENYIFNYVEEELHDCSLLIFFTDGHTDLDGIWGKRQHSFPTIFVGVEEAHNNVNGMKKWGTYIESSLKD